MTDFTVANKELSLHEMLADPIVQTVMKRDGVTRQQIERLIEARREKLGGKRLNGQRFDRYGVSEHASQRDNPGHQLRLVQYQVRTICQ